MKTLKVLCLLVCLPPLAFAQSVEFGSDLNISQPLGTMAGNMNNAFGLTLEASRNFKVPFSLGAEIRFGNYGYQTSRQQFTFEDGSVTETDVNVSNNLFNMNLTGKHFLRNGKIINPYLSAKAGWAWFSTTLTIEDPEDVDGCQPLDSDILARDNTYSVSAGTGVRVDFVSMFRNITPQKWFFDLSVHATRGGTVKYMNSEADTSQPTPDEDIVARFIHHQTQVIHEHHVGYVYSSVLNMIEYRLGVVFRPGAR